MARKHAEWSASATQRNLACPGSLSLIAVSQPAKETIHAAYGTAVHSVAELSLRNDHEPTVLIDTIQKTDAFAISVDEELVDAAKVYTDYVRSRLTDGCQYWLEETFDLSSLGLPISAGGTSDCVIWNPIERMWEIVDLKGGRGHFVDIDTPQLPLYGVGALVKHPELPAEWVRLTIVQPRIPSPDGVIRSKTFHVSDLVDYLNDTREGMERTLKARAELDEADGDEAKLDIWRDKWLKPGDYCTFCSAAGQCPALRKKAQEMVGLYWDDDTPTIAIAENSPEAVERDLEAFDLVEEWLTARRAFAHQLAEGGHQFANWVLVEKNGHRRWNEAESMAAGQIVAATGLSMVELFTHKLKSPKGVEDILGASRKGKIADLYHVPVIGRDLVRRSKAVRRRPAKSLVEEFFNSETGS